MAAYAALVSLMNTMDDIQIHPHLSTSFDKSHLESLGDTVNFLLDFIESYNCGGSSKELEDLEGGIASAAHAAEDAIESCILDLIDEKNGGKLQKLRITKNPEEFHLPSVICDLQKVTDDVRKMGKQERFKYQTPNAASSRPVSAGNRKTRMVGFEGHLLCLMDKLMAQSSQPLLILPIVGMGGVGKTTLARNAFESLTIKQHFDVCAWATISQSFSFREILLQLFPIQCEEDSSKIGDLELGEKLRKYLFGRRYLIILDDVWKIDVWDDIKFCFPDYNNEGSCIVLTTRILAVALHFNSNNLEISFLDEVNSWDLFCQESFGEEVCPAELEEVGKKICKNCKGLPLCIVVIGGFLRKSSKAVEYWEGIARDTYSILSLEGENEVMNILSLSYSHLPAHLKPCFLYMGVFVEDEKINVSRLIKRWVAEGFVRPNDGQTLEEVAEGYFKDLVDRNLILVTRLGSNGKKIRTCSIHDLIRELCLMVAKKEKFLCVVNMVGTPRAINRKRRTFIERGPKITIRWGFASYVRFFIYKLMHEGFLEVGLRCVNLRFLQHRYQVFSRGHPPHQIPKKIFFLWNLQTVIIEGHGAKFTAPSELWEMIQLRHLKVSDLSLPNPPQNDRVDLALPNLQTFCMVMNLRLSEEVCKRIPNVKKLSLKYSKLMQRRGTCLYYCPQNLGRFHKLESLTLIFRNQNWRSMVVNMTFPSSVKKLSLFGGGLYWEDLRMIGALPNLQVLKLSHLKRRDSKWNPVEGEFCSLKFLRIYRCTLTEWNVDHSHFPVLEKLVLQRVENLYEIPLGIGEIPTLQFIRLFQCSVPCALSAVKILEEQEANGNEDLQLEVGFFNNNKKDTGRFKKMMEQEGLTSKNLHIKRSNRCEVCRKPRVLFQAP